ncbi:hypothetical protein GGR57DRAFT_125436 [Xylariaceae sp. FL1272]|nr:hypothetical protein GGR57DRAFT_125436 [Xylariaceae sp. FL1272]
MLSKQSTILLTAAFFGLLRGGAAAPSARSTEFATCIQQCIRGAGCFSDFDSCVCEKASDGILSDIASCMNQECPSTTTVLDLIQPLQSSCKLSDSDVSAAEKIGGVSSGGGGDDNDEPTTTSEAAITSEPTATSSSHKHEPTTTSTKVSSAAVGVPASAGGDTTMATSTRAASVTDIATVSSLVVAQSTPPVPSATSGSVTSSSESDSDDDSDSDNSSSSTTDDGESGAGAVSPMSMLGVVAAIGAAVVLF